jgi:hypothetical protein
VLLVVFVEHFGRFEEFELGPVLAQEGHVVESLGLLGLLADLGELFGFRLFLYVDAGLLLILFAGDLNEVEFPEGHELLPVLFYFDFFDLLHQVLLLALGLTLHPHLAEILLHLTLHFLVRANLNARAFCQFLPQLPSLF